MKIYVDGDGCPVVDLAVEIAKEYKLEIILVINYAHQVESDYAQVISVDTSNDSVDFYIVNKIKKGDLVISQDYGLASLALAKGAYPINENGYIFTEDNIEARLNRRHIHRKLRQGGYRHSNPGKRKPKDNLKFKLRFKELIEKHIK